MQNTGPFHAPPHNQTRYGSTSWMVENEPSVSPRLSDIAAPSFFQRIPWDMKLLAMIEVIALSTGIVYFWRPASPVAPLFILTLLPLVLLWFVALFRTFLAQDRRVGTFCGGLFLVMPLVLILALVLARTLPGGYSLPNIAAMRNVVFDMERGALSFENGRVFTLPKRYRTLSYAVSASRDANNGLTVTFYERRDFPQRRVVYLYRSDNTLTPEIIQRWPRHIPLIPNWYEVTH